MPSTRQSRAQFLARTWSISREWPLRIDAPVPTYEIDHLVQEFCEREIFVNAGVIKTRTEVIWAATRAAWSAREQSVEHPLRVAQAKRFFEDLERFRALAKRVQKHHLSTIATALSGWEDDDGDELYEKAMFWAEDIQSLANSTIGETDRYLEHFQLPSLRRGNCDPLVSEFIDRMHIFWSGATTRWPDRYVGLKTVRPFARLLAAAWRDLGLPLHDHGGDSREPIEEWFADRIRKHRKLSSKSPQ